MLVSEIKEKLATELIPALANSGMTFSNNLYPAGFVGNGYCLAEIQDFGGLLPKAFAAGVPVFAITNEEIGEAGNVLTSLTEKREILRNSIQNASNQIAEFLENA